MDADRSQKISVEELQKVLAAQGLVRPTWYRSSLYAADMDHLHVVNQQARGCHLKNSPHLQRWSEVGLVVAENHHSAVAETPAYSDAKIANRNVIG